MKGGAAEKEEWRVIASPAFPLCQCSMNDVPVRCKGNHHVLKKGPSNRRIMEAEALDIDYHDYLPFGLPEDIAGDPRVHIPIMISTLHYYLNLFSTPQKILFSFDGLKINFGFEQLKCQ